MKTQTKRSQLGQAITEFALVIPIFLALLFGVLEFGRAIYQWHTMFEAAKEGVRAAAMSISTATADIQKVGSDTVTANINGRFAIKSITVNVPADMTTDPINIHIESDFTGVVGALIPSLTNVPLMADASAFYATLAGAKNAAEPPKPMTPAEIEAAEKAAEEAKAAAEAAAKAAAEAAAKAAIEKKARESEFNDKVDNTAWPDLTDKNKLKSDFAAKNEAGQKDWLGKDIASLLDSTRANRKYSEAYNEGRKDAYDWAKKHIPFDDHHMDTDVDMLSHGQQHTAKDYYNSGVAQGYVDYQYEVYYALLPVVKAEGYADGYNDNAKKIDTNLSAIDSIEGQSHSKEHQLEDQVKSWLNSQYNSQWSAGRTKALKDAAPTPEG